MKKVVEILKNIDVLKISGDTETPVPSISFDSRKIGEGGMFIAVKGTQVDGHVFIDQAVKDGAKIVVAEHIPGSIPEDVVAIQVNDSTKALGHIASNFYDNPSEKLKLVGVTGTNGKTTIVTLLHALFTKLGYAAGLLSTVSNKIGTTDFPATHTTPDAVQINKLMQEMVEAGIEYCFMEVSSHALQQKRIIGLNFTGGVFTNISHDHLDYHKSFQNYIKAKKIFFDELPSDAFALINQDDKNANIMVQNSSATIYKYALKSMADYKARILENHFDGTMIRINDQELWIRLIGKFNTYNILAIYGVAMLLGQDNKSVLTALSTLKAAPGRFEYTVSEDHKTGIVDYAHTPDALSNVLKTIVQVRKPGQKIYTVVGAGGNRDKEKRPLMAKVASELSDRVILTSDNPRDEEPEEIIADMLEGVKESKNILTITNRKEAIRGAVMMASPGDIILVAGKGHETYQEVKGVRSDFDDREVLKESFKSI